MLRTSKERKAFFRHRHTTLISFAGMAELADALDSGSSEVTFVQVQVLLPAPIKEEERRSSSFIGLCHSSQKLPNAIGVGSRQRLAVCKANDGRCPSRQTCRRAKRDRFNLSCYPHQKYGDELLFISIFFV